jgi:hypothetical protein
VRFESGGHACQVAGVDVVLGDHVHDCQDGFLLDGDLLDALASER